MYDEKTALIVVDVQNDFAHPEGSLFVSGGDSVPARVNDEIEKAQQAGALIVYTQDWHPADTKHFEQWPPHCIANTWGADFHIDLDVVTDEIVRKGIHPDEDGYSGFSVLTLDDVVKTELDDILSERGIEHVVVVGIALDVCVKETVFDAISLGYGTTVILDATASVTEQGGLDAERDLEAAGVRLV